MGYSVNYYTRNMIRSDSIKYLAVDGVNPNDVNIRTRNYGYTADVFVVIRNDLDTASNAYKLYRLLLEDPGQKEIEESGYIPYY
ncbi:MAG: hypothetical protein HC906_14510 [Bacteroidales bacterium]|nr:hypothetical protein [Bacteroidales bacterium]